MYYDLDHREIKTGNVDMKAVLVFIDGTICDTSHRHQLMGLPGFYEPWLVLEDRAVPGSVECLSELRRRYEIVYMGARPASTHTQTVEWLDRMGYPQGEVLLAENQAGRLFLVSKLKSRLDFIAGIGDRWDDNELHAELGCLSIILEEFEGKWDGVSERIQKHHRTQKVRENRIRLEGKVEGLARVCPLLLSRYGEGLWEAYQDAVLEMAEATREARRTEELALFAQHNLDPADLSHAARLDDLLRSEDWENNSAYGLQEFELVEATPERYVHKVTACYYAELWKKHGRADIGYQVHCRTDKAWWDRPVWNEAVRFEQPKTLMQGDEYCLFIQHLPEFH